MINSLWPPVLEPARFLCPRNSPGKNTGVGSHSLLFSFSSPSDLPNPGSLAGRFFTVWATREALHSCRAQTNSCLRKDPRERSSEPTGYWTRPTHQCWRVSSGGMGWQWLIMGHGCWQQQYWEALLGMSPLGGHYNSAIEPANSRAGSPQAK